MAGQGLMPRRRSLTSLQRYEQVEIFRLQIFFLCWLLVSDISTNKMITKSTLQDVVIIRFRDLKWMFLPAKFNNEFLLIYFRYSYCKKLCYVWKIFKYTYNFSLQYWFLIIYLFFIYNCVLINIKNCKWMIKLIK